MSILEGSINAIQIRILVPDTHQDEARALLTAFNFPFRQ